MFRLRTIIVLGVTAVALWGLFSLLSRLKEPGLLRTPQATVVKGCENPASNLVCDSLLCEKALIDSKLVSFRTQFNVTTTRVSAPEKLIGGSTLTTPTSIPVFFACVVQSHKVTVAKLVTSAELATLAAQAGNWNLEK
jgi:hypothetical protein